MLHYIVCVGVSVSSVSLRLQSLWFSFLQRRAEYEQRSSRIRTGAVTPVRSEPILLAAMPREPQKPASNMFWPVMLNKLNRLIFFPHMLFFSSDANDLSAILIQICSFFHQCISTKLSIWFHKGCNITHINSQTKTWMRPRIKYFF